ncbi:hypothetical protein [Roseitranquillus sediminis]|uniref:hypothetical protein n=1 Tax=Roseitranquillus sediminis TaxID=2809051 RepID=UPI001D0C3C18|nr:hypothetical protein [Roseitranquillus sediminis]MBM9594636.1 hypothetical protein [Roseitranquillus sediminis]
MTALADYQRLESTGLWRPEPGAQRREVIVCLGEATLVITDRGESALAHWSLPAVERRGADLPAIYAPGSDSDEELEIADGEMVDAIETVRRAVERRRYRPGRLRTALGVGALAALLGVGALWLPDALIRHTARVVPQAMRLEIGEAMLGHVLRVAGPPCATSEDLPALARINRRLRGAEAGPLVLVPGEGFEALHLPGGLIVLNRVLVEDHDEPAVVAGYILAEEARAAANDPMLRLLDEAGPLASFRLLTTGELPPEVLEAHAERLATADPAPLSGAELVTWFEGAALRSAPYAYALDITGETTLTLIEADPAKAGTTTTVLPDGEWVALQGACGA